MTMAPVGVVQRDPLVQRREDRPVPLLALPHRLLGPLAVGDVGDGAVEAHNRSPPRVLAEVARPLADTQWTDPSAWTTRYSDE